MILYIDKNIDMYTTSLIWERKKLICEDKAVLVVDTVILDICLQEFTATYWAPVLHF